VQPEVRELSKEEERELDKQIDDLNERVSNYSMKSKGGKQEEVYH
jgi:hypothetical protein